MFVRSLRPVSRRFAALVVSLLLAVSLAAGLLAAQPAVARGFDARTEVRTDARPGGANTRFASIDVRDLPIEAQWTLVAIRRGGPFASSKDGIVFFNREKLLPYRPRGYYTEYTVRTPGVRNRGARRIVAGGDPRTSGVYYYTEDHYQSFRRIRE